MTDLVQQIMMQKRPQISDGKVTAWKKETIQKRIRITDFTWNQLDFERPVLQFFLFSFQHFIYNINILLLPSAFICSECLEKMPNGINENNINVRWEAAVKCQDLLS